MSSGPIEFTCETPTIDQLHQIDWEVFDGAYLGNPYCLRFDGNLLVELDQLAQAVELVRQAGRKAYVSTPIITLESDLGLVKLLLETTFRAGATAVEISDMGVLRLARQTYPQLPVHLGMFANVYHRLAAGGFMAYGVSRIHPSQELTLAELGEIAGAYPVEVSVYGQSPLGLANACLLSMELPSRRPVACQKSCREPHWLQFDGWRMRSGGTATFTAEAVSMVEHLEKLVDVGIKHLRFRTTWEESETANKVGKLYRKALRSEIPSGGVGELANEVRQISKLELCNGWFFGRSGREYVDAAICNLPSAIW